MIKQFLETGKITGTHGIRGEMRLQPWSDSPQFVTNLKRLYLDDKGDKYIDVAHARAHGNMVILKASGVDTIEEAEKMRGKVVYASRDDMPLDDGKYFVSELIGCEVSDADSGEVYGKLTDVSVTGANDVWHIDVNGREVLIPAIPDVVVSVDVKDEKITIRPIAGLFDEN